MAVREQVDSAKLDETLSDFRILLNEGQKPVETTYVWNVKNPWQNVKVREACALIEQASRQDEGPFADFGLFRVNRTQVGETQVDWYRGTGFYVEIAQHFGERKITVFGEESGAFKGEMKRFVSKQTEKTVYWH